MMSAEKVDMARLNNVILQTEDGQALPMKSLWRTKPAIFIFLRHFSCIACRAHVAQVWSHREKLEQNGAHIYFIGNGSFREIIKFKKDLGVEKAQIFTDPSRRSYSAAGLRRGIMPTLGPQAIVNGIELLRQGHRQRSYHREAGDLWQLGGVMIVNPGGQVRYHYISETTGDFPAAGEMGQTPPPAPAQTADFSMR